jgi:hypothetical protein
MDTRSDGRQHQRGHGARAWRVLHRVRACCALSCAGRNSSAAAAAAAAGGREAFAQRRLRCRAARRCAAGAASSHAGARYAANAAAPLPRTPRRCVLRACRASSHTCTHALHACPTKDDHNLNLRLCRRLLETAGGLQVVTADDGDVALRVLIDSYDAARGGVPVDLVLMDLQARLRCAATSCTSCMLMLTHVLAGRCRAWMGWRRRARFVHGSAASGRRPRGGCPSSRSPPTCSTRKSRSAPPPAWMVRAA